MRRVHWSWVVIAGLCASASNATAFEKREGCFLASEACPAFASFRKETNPGEVALEPGSSYALQGVNDSRDPSHAQLIVPGAEPATRWAALACGQVIPSCEASTSDRPARDAGASAAASNDDGAVASTPNHRRNVLAVNWQPAFCEARPRTTECRSQDASRFDASHFSLHGLWPQPRDRVYCDGDRGDENLSREGRWDLLDPLALTPSVEDELDRVMPGAQSFLERHEWVKHGSCYGTSADEYYADSLALMAQLNDSDVRRLFALSVGSELDVEEVRAAFDASFGPRAGDRVRMRCLDDGARHLVVELWILLDGQIDGEASLEDLIAAAPPVRDARSDCSRGEIDAVGLLP